MAQDFISDQEMTKLSGGAHPEFISDADMSKHTPAQSPPQPPMGPFPESQITQEMHPDLGHIERLLVKNFSNNPGATMDYLKERHPDLQFHQMKNQLLVKRPDETQWKVLDPENMPITGKAGFSGYLTHPGEALQDVGDQAFNLGAGALQAGAATAGAAGGGALGALGGPAAPATIPAGAIAGGMAASGGAGAGLEALRQGIGRVLGINKEINPTDIKMQGAIGALMPPLVGTGASKGLLGALYRGSADSLYPKLASAASGISSDTIKALKAHLPEISEMGQTGVMPFVQDWHSRLLSGYNGLKQKVGGALEKAIGESGEKVSLAPVKAPIKAALVEAQKKFEEFPNQYNQQAVEDLQSHYDDLFTQKIKDAEGDVVKKEIPDEILPSTLFDIQDHLKDASQAGSIKGGLNPRYGAGASKADKAVADTVLDAYKAANQELDRATSGLSTELKDQYRALSRTREVLAPLFSSPEKAYSTLSNLDKQAKQPIFETLKGLEAQGIPLLQDAKKLQAYNVFHQPAALPQSGLGTTSTSRSIPLQTLGGTLGALLGYKVGHGYGPAAVGGILGSKAGGYLGSPAMVKNSVLLQRALEGLGSKIPEGPARAALYGQGRNAWDALSEQSALDEMERQKQGAGP